MKKGKLILLLSLALVVCCALATACNPTVVTESYYVTFDSQDGSEPQRVLFDENFAAPEVTREGYDFGGWYTDAECSDGALWTKPETLTADITLYAKWTEQTVEHVHDFGDNYFTFVKCSSSDCEVVGRNASTDSAKENFVYSFNDEKKAEINGHYDDLVNNLGVVTEEEYEDLFYVYDDDLSYVVEQYQCAYVFYYTYYDEESTNNFKEIEAFYNEHVSKYYGLFRKVYESDYKDEFFAGWSEDDIKQILAMSDQYGNEEYIALQDQIDTVLHEYDELVDAKNKTGKKLTAKYQELVELNNQLAVLQGYENYMDYAYAVRYEREYSPEEVVTMRNYVKEYIGPLLNKIYMRYYTAYQNAGTLSTSFYDSFSASVFGEKTASNTIANHFLTEYLQQMTYDEGSKPIDYFQYVNELFKNGNYYLGVQTGAFTYWIPSQQMSVLYFGEDYQGAFTFVHEFGHYYNGIYNSGLSLSMDHDETQSQGDEMLFLAWLASNATDYASGVEYLSSYELFNMIWIINIATAVDEFEYAVYTDSYNGESVKDNYEDYCDLFSEIMGTYSSYLTSNNGMKNYWYQVAFHSAAYYISYAMSALPSLEIYVNGMQDFEAAKVSYFKLYTFSDNSDLVSVDDDGNKTVTATYAEILHYCGLQSAFDEGLYTTIYNYFVG